MACCFSRDHNALPRPDSISQPPTRDPGRLTADVERSPPVAIGSRPERAGYARFLLLAIALYGSAPLRRKLRLFCAPFSIRPGCIRMAIKKLPD